MGKWIEKPLSELAVLNKDSWKVGDEEAPYIALEHIKEGKLKLIGLGHSSSVTSNKYRFCEDNFLFGKLRPYFRKVVRPKISGICSTDIWVVGANNIDLDFLFYLFASKEFVDLSYSGSSGTKMPRADWNYMKDTVWLVPDEITEQKAIASVLSSLDDKIDLLQRQNQTLEALAQTLFRQWFVEEAEDDWKEGVIPDEFDFTMGLSPPGSSYNENDTGIAMFQGNKDFGFRFPANRVYTTDPRRFAEKFDTLISVRAPVGAQNMALEKCCIGRGVAAFRYKRDKFYYSYTYYKLRSLMDEIRMFDNEGTVFGSIGKRDFMALEIVVPPNELIDHFQSTVNPIDEKIILNTNQIRTLESLRDTLLPKLMSGEVRVQM
jgi:type I restriction enzyme, S subunit